MAGAPPSRPSAAAASDATGVEVVGHPHRLDVAVGTVVVTPVLLTERRLVAHLDAWADLLARWPSSAHASDLVYLFRKAAEELRETPGGAERPPSDWRGCAAGARGLGGTSPGPS
jgi:hypothetical protein